MNKRFDKVKKRSEELLRLDDDLRRVMFDRKTVNGKIEYHYRAKKYINLSLRCAAENINRPRLPWDNNIPYLEVYDLDYLFARDYLDERVSPDFIKDGIRQCSTIVAGLDKRSAMIYIDATFSNAYYNYICGTLGSKEEERACIYWIDYHEGIRYTLYEKMKRINGVEILKFVNINLDGMEVFNLEA